jgi:GT2 family glycosyltransferase
VAHEAPRGLNAARNTGIASTDAELLVFVDDDVEAAPGWLAALLHAAAELPEEVGVLTGPIRPRFEDHRFTTCGREGPPVTFQDFGPEDRDCEHAWGANMAIRRSAFDAVGRFEDGAALFGAGRTDGDEQEWQERWRAAGGRLRYVAAAGLDHRRAGDDARLRSLCRAAYVRGRASRRFDVFRRGAPSLAAELRVLAGCAAHGPLRRCMNGPVLTAHSAGRLREALLPGRTAPPAPADGFLAGASGTVGGRRGTLLRGRDALLDLAAAPHRRRLRAMAAGDPPRRRVLAVGIERPEIENLMAVARTELLASRHEVEVHTAAAGSAGKFENLNALLADRDADRVDWLLVVDDDVALPRHFLDLFLLCAEDARLRIAQPAHRKHSHAAWDVTRRVRGADWHETTFVEIGPVTAFHRDTFPYLLPFPDLRMGWGLDAHWSAVAREHGWPIGVVDATPIGHTLRQAGATYSQDAAIAEGRAFLAGKPYVHRDEVRTIRSGRVR